MSKLTQAAAASGRLGELHEPLDAFAPAAASAQHAQKPDVPSGSPVGNKHHAVHSAASPDMPARSNVGVSAHNVGAGGLQSAERLHAAPQASASANPQQQPASEITLLVPERSTALESQQRAAAAKPLKLPHAGKRATGWRLPWTAQGRRPHPHLQHELDNKAELHSATGPSSPCIAAQYGRSAPSIHHTTAVAAETQAIAVGEAVAFDTTQSEPSVHLAHEPSIPHMTRLPSASAALTETGMQPSTTTHAHFTDSLPATINSTGKPESRQQASQPGKAPAQAQAYGFAADAAQSNSIRVGVNLSNIVMAAVPAAEPADGILEPQTLIVKVQRCYNMQPKSAKADAPVSVRLLYNEQQRETRTRVLQDDKSASFKEVFTMHTFPHLRYKLELEVLQHTRRYALCGGRLLLHSLSLRGDLLSRVLMNCAKQTWERSLIIACCLDHSPHVS